MRRCGCELPMGYEAGMFIWARLPAGVKGEQLAEAGLKRGMVFAPGALFGYEPGLHDFMRFNVAHCDDPRVCNAIEQLLR